jgi:hypothetical protein
MNPHPQIEGSLGSPIYSLGRPKSFVKEPNFNHFLKSKVSSSGSFSSGKRQFQHHI